MADDATLTLRRAGADDRNQIEGLLAANDLPHDDVHSGAATFFVAESGDEVVGVGGLEVYGSVALLRSVVVEAWARGEGYGSALCDALEARARDAGVDVLYLLTTTAAEFFERRGYEVVERDAAPAEISETSEFRDLCPASATCMRKRL